GTGCDGLLFRIPRDRVDVETEVLWRREQVGPAYLPAFVTSFVDGGRVEALTFVADHSADLIDHTMTREDQVRYLATGEGFAGSSLDYLRNIHRKFALLKVHDEDVDALLRDVEAYLAAS
ncbi:MAG: gamma-glutamylcyclotransferase, partial [Roseibium sp.]|nr:gamma-glutamylcyclotransferase [Roseibium sp.]